MTDIESGHAPGLGELSRQVRDVLVRFEKLATQLENQFVRRDFYEWQRQALERDLKEVDDSVKDLEKTADAALKEFKAKVEAERVSKENHATLERRVAALEDTLKWLGRIVIGFVIAGVLTATIVFGKPGGP